MYECEALKLKCIKRIRPQATPSFRCVRACGCVYHTRPLPTHAHMNAKYTVVQYKAALIHVLLANEPRPHAQVVAV